MMRFPFMTYCLRFPTNRFTRVPEAQTRLLLSRRDVFVSTFSSVLETIFSSLENSLNNNFFIN